MRYEDPRASPALAVILRVRAHIDRGGDAVGHVEECRDRGDVPDVTIRKAHIAQRLAVGLLNRCGGDGHLHGKVQHCALSWIQGRGAVVHDQSLTKGWIAGQLAHSGAVGDQTVKAFVHR